jgi:predicted XRE-type DNA-binding protein
MTKPSTSYTLLRSEAARRGKAILFWLEHGCDESRKRVERSAMSDQIEVPDMSIKLTKSSGNVFVDIGFPPEEAENLLIRSHLMSQVINIIESQGLTQKEAAKLFGVTQPRISDLVRDRIDLFSIDMLVRMLASAGIHVSLTVEPATRGSA